MEKKFEMMITYHAHMKNNHNFKIVVLEILGNSKYNLECSNFMSHLLNVNES